MTSRNEWAGGRRYGRGATFFLGGGWEAGWQGRGEDAGKGAAVVVFCCSFLKGAGPSGKMHGEPVHGEPPGRSMGGRPTQTNMLSCARHTRTSQRGNPPARTPWARRSRGCLTAPHAPGERGAKVGGEGGRRRRRWRRRLGRRGGRRRRHRRHRCHRYRPGVGAGGSTAPPGLDGRAHAAHGDLPAVGGGADGWCCWRRGRPATGGRRRSHGKGRGERGEGGQGRGSEPAAQRRKCGRDVRQGRGVPRRPKLPARKDRVGGGERGGRGDPHGRPVIHPRRWMAAEEG